MISALNNLQIIVVAARAVGRQAVKTDNAALRQTAILGAVLAYASAAGAHRTLTGSVLQKPALTSRSAGD